MTDREADAFEAYAVAQLKKGEMLVRWDRPDFLRYVGAIRASAACLSCHDGAKEGDALGAFAYDYNKVARPRDAVASRTVIAARAGKSLAELVALEGGQEKDAEQKLALELSQSGVVIPEMIAMQKQNHEDALHYSMMWLKGAEARPAK